MHLDIPSASMFSTPAPCLTWNHHPDDTSGTPTIRISAADLCSLPPLQCVIQWIAGILSLLMKRLSRNSNSTNNSTSKPTTYLHLALLPSSDRHPPPGQSSGQRLDSNRRGYLPPSVHGGPPQTGVSLHIACTVLYCTVYTTVKFSFAPKRENKTNQNNNDGRRIVYAATARSRRTRSARCLSKPLRTAPTVFVTKYLEILWSRERLNPSSTAVLVWGQITRT